MGNIEEDDIEEDDFEEDTNFCSGKIPFNIKCGKIALTISLHNFTKFHIQYQLREFALTISLHKLTKFHIEEWRQKKEEDDFKSHCGIFKISIAEISRYTFRYTIWRNFRYTIWRKELNLISFSPIFIKLPFKKWNQVEYKCMILLLNDIVS